MVHATHATGFEGPLSTTDSEAIALLRSVLDRHGFSGTAVTDALGNALPFGKSHLRDDLPLYLKRVAAPTPINTLVKLFVLDRWVEEFEAVKAFAPLSLDRLRAMGLIRTVPNGIRACLRLSAYDGLILAHDAYDEDRRSLAPDHVLDVNPTTISLSNLTVRRPVNRALEIGTGCGVLAIVAARHAVHVVATDTNPRALNVARFNCAINGVNNVELRQGSLFDAVLGEKFDLIFSNPPYVISPDSQFIFRDGGRRGDSLCKEIVQRAPLHLNPGGFLTVLINWTIRQGQEWSTPLRRWVENNQCDSWLMLSHAQDPMTYAALWNRSRDRNAYTSGLDRWMRYFEELGLEAIGMGAIVLRKSHGSRETGVGSRAGVGGRAGVGHTWVRADHLSDNVTAPAGKHIERLFDAQDRLARLSDDDALLAQFFVVAPDHVLQQNLSVKDGSYSINAAEVRLLDGLPFRGTIDTFATQLLSRCDGNRPLAEIAFGIASAAGADYGKFATACADIARRLIAQGFLVPPHKTPAGGPSPNRLEGSVA